MTTPPGPEAARRLPLVPERERLLAIDPLAGEGRQTHQAADGSGSEGRVGAGISVLVTSFAGAVVTLIATALLPRPVDELERPPTGRFTRRAEDREAVATGSSSRA